MQTFQVRRRSTDRILIMPSWARVHSEAEYVTPKEPSINDTLGGHTIVHTAAKILYQGLWLQRAVAEHNPTLASERAAELARHVDFENNIYEESPRERVAAAFLIWPFYSAKYYGYSEATNEDRRAARRTLCQIQAILYNNIRTLLDILRLWFDCYEDGHILHYVTDPQWHRSWRPVQLTQFAPDLCAVDFLVQHVLELTKARPLIRKAIESVQQISLNSDMPLSTLPSAAVQKACADVTAAFKSLRLTQMTVFYNPEPSQVRGEIPLKELVHETKDDPIPSMLIPFEGEPGLVRNFRHLASNIYKDSAANKQHYPSFFEHRNTVIDLLKAEADVASGFVKGATRFVSDGETTRSFLSSEPPKPTLRTSSSNGGSDESTNGGWPIWYSRSLAEIDLTGNFPDWSDWEFWWRPIDSQELKRLLFPGENEETHLNHHRSAYWDELGRSGIFLDPVEIPPQRPISKPAFGHLMELLLRREHETRTSFFFALAQTYEEGNARLCHFVGGTFLGLERPGIPFCEERFQAIAARVRGLVMAVGHYTATHTVKIERINAGKERNDFRKRMDRLVELLRGARDGEFNRKECLLFASRPEGKAGDDHPLTVWRPSRQQIKRVFADAEHLIEHVDDHTAIPRNCDQTWKGLFYLGGDSEQHFTLDKFRADWKEALGEDRSDVAHRDIQCAECFKVVLQFLFGNSDRTFRHNLVITTPFRLPTRPGIRFLLVLCRFICHIQSEITEGNSSVTALEFGRGFCKMSFDNPNLIQYLDQKGDQPARFSHTVGRFKALASATVFSKDDQTIDAWHKFLNDPQYAAPLLPLELNAADCQITLRWNDE